MGVEQMKEIGGLIAAVLDAPEDETVQSATREKVLDLCQAFPIYPDLTYEG